MKIAVIGLGTVGKTLCAHLYHGGVEVLAIDSDSDLINEVADYTTGAVRFDATNIEGLKNFKLDEYDAAIVAIGDSFESSVLITAQLKEIGVKKVFSRATNELNKTILSKVGADEVFIPEKRFAENLADRIMHKRAVDVIKLNADYSILEVFTPSKFIGKTLIEIDVRRNYNVNIVTLRTKSGFVKSDESKKEEYDLVSLPSGNTKLTGDEIVVIVGRNEDVKRFAEVR